MNRSKIEWCNHTWNPITGCRHNCSYCYARRMSARFAGDVRLNKMAKREYYLEAAADESEDLYVLDTPMLNETGNPLVYPFGFEPTLHRYRMDTLEKLKMGNNIFIGAMADVFGEWVPDEWIREVFTACIERSIHNYLFLTKNPGRYERLDDAGMLPIDQNFWYGSTLTTPKDKCFVSNRHNTFWSIEPLHASFQIWDRDNYSPDWIIIGAETGHRKGKVIPQKEWVEDIVNWCDKYGIPIFMKDSLIPIVEEKNMRRDFPEQLRNVRISRKMEDKLFGVCAKCKSYSKKSEMITIMAKSRRKEAARHFGFMCKDCFKKFCRELKLDIPELSALMEDKTQISNTKEMEGVGMKDENTESGVGTEAEQD